jgi:hypothetical protein
MATSIFSGNQKELDMKASKLITLLAILILPTSSLFSQSYLIPVDAPNNIYPITFTDAAQRVLILQFDRAVTSPGTATGWTITVGGVPVVMVGPPTAALNSLRITLPASITYANRNSVIVSYSNLLGTLTLTGGLNPNIVNVQAINNYFALAADIISGVTGENPPKDICAPVLNVEVESNIFVTSRFRNSIHFVTPLVYIRWTYPLDIPKTISVPYIESAPGSGLYKSN